MSSLNTKTCCADVPGSRFLHILFVNHLRLGSASSYRQAGLAKYLRRLGHTCELLGLPAHPERSGPAPQDWWDSYERVAYWKEPLVGRGAANLGLMVGSCRRNDVVHVNRAHPYTATLALAARGVTRELVVDMEDWDGFGGYSSFAGKYGPSGALLTLYELVLPRAADQVLTVSGLLMARMRRTGVPDYKLTVIPNGFDPELFHPGADGGGARARYSLRGKVIIYASTFWPFELEVHRLVLRSFAEVLKALPDVSLLVVGRGNPPVVKMADELGVGGKVAFTGFVPRAELPGLMAAADVAVHMISGHPFHLASSPMIVPEYMAMGKPIVAPAFGELRTMLGGGGGTLVETPDPKGMASAIVRVLEDASLRKELGRRAAERAAELYSYEVLAKRLEGVYVRGRRHA